jgi:hypothetical protein
MGRPRKEIDFVQFEKLCGLQCTEPEICSFFGINTDTLCTRCKEQYGKTFKDVYAEKSQSGRIAIRRAQMQAALAGDKTMLVWLGKNMLGQKDAPVEVTGAGGGPLVIMKAVRPEAEEDERGDQ